jgi:hypothetical protein
LRDITRSQVDALKSKAVAKDVFISEKVSWLIQVNSGIDLGRCKPGVLHKLRDSKDMADLRGIRWM